MIKMKSLVKTTLLYAALTQIERKILDDSLLPIIEKGIVIITLTL